MLRHPRKEPELPAFSVEGSLDLRVAAEFSEREPDGFWHPSSLFGCLRQAIYAARGTEVTDPRDARSRRVLRVGHVLHEYVQGAIEADPSVVWAEHEVKLLDLEHRIKGSLDELIFVWLGLEPAPPVASLPRALELLAQGLVRIEVIELKTINSIAFKYKDLPKPDHVGQVATYLHVLCRHGATAADGTVIPPTQAHARVAYVSKDDLRLSEHTVFLTEGKEREIVSRAGTLDRYGAPGEVSLPPRLAADKSGKRHFLCSYCPYQQRCYELDGSGVELREVSG